MRLFVAIDLTDDARAAIAEAGKQVVSRVARQGNLRLVRLEHLHLTLEFIGEVDETRAASISQSIAVPFDQPAFEIVFGGVGVFPPRGAPHILWLGVTQGAEQTTALQREVGGRLRSLGVETEDRPYSPHLTLARWRGSRPSDARAALREKIGPMARMPVTFVTLYQSVLSPSGPTYSVLTRTTLHRRD